MSASNSTWKAAIRERRRDAEESADIKRLRRKSARLANFPQRAEAHDIAADEKEDEEENTTYSGIVMCEPSPIDKSIPKINYIDDESLWKPYEETVPFLHYVHSKIKIPCLPRFKVIDDGKIVGVITETDQFISVSIDENDSKRIDGIFNIPIINTSDYNIADTEIIDPNSNFDDILGIKYTIKFNLNKC